MTRIQARRLEKLEDSALALGVPAVLDAGGWDALFGRKSHLELEIGLGKDPHLITRAAAHPDIDYVGLEYSLKKLDKFLAKAERSGVENLRVLQADAFRVLDPLFAASSLDAAYILFPDPWPKKRHRKKRLVQPGPIATLTEKLKPGGRLELRTDDSDYASQMLEVLAGEPGLENVEGEDRWRTSPLDPERHVPTLFETKFRERGLVIHYFYYVRRGHRDL